MKDCFDIGLRLCGSVHERYIEEIEGVSSHLVASIKDDERQSVDEFVNRIKEDSWAKFKKDVEFGFGKQKSFNHIVAQSQPFSVSRNKNLLNIKGLEGYNVTMPYHEFVELRIDSIGIYAHSEGNLTFQVIDLCESVIILSQDFKIKKGKQSLLINKIVENDFSLDLFVCIKTDAVLFEMDCDEFKECCNCECEKEYEVGRIMECEAKSIENIEWIEQKSFCLKAEIGCNFENILCEYSSYFMDARLYGIAIKLLNEKLHSYKVGWFTNANNKIVEEVLLPKLQEEYFHLIGLAVRNIQGIMNDSICWECDAINGKYPMVGSLA